MSTLILVESPTKARTLTRFFGDKYDVEASIGHIRDLPRGDIGVDIEHDFEPRYVTPKAKQKTLTLLKKKVKKADTVLLATDPDREGEAISYHLLEMLRPEAKKGAVFKRIVFHEITRDAIEEALNNPREIDEKLVDAQIARRVLDRIVGYKVSPILWKKIKRNLSAGRVQSIALRLIVEREREIAKFNSEEYYKIFVILRKTESGNSGLSEVQFELTSINGEKIEQTEKLDLYDGQYTYTKTTLNESLADKIIAELSAQSYTVSDVAKKQNKRSPLPPFITSSMQIEAARKLSFNSRKTMQVAQKLYEEGHITYHRTDSFNLSHQFITKARDFIQKEFGEKYLHDGNRIFKTKSKVAQEAHEAIRPTEIENFEEVKRKIAGELGRDGVRLYELIYKRAIATQMADALFESTKITVKTLLGHVFEKSGSVLLFDGYLKLWYREDGEEFLPEFDSGEILPFVNAQKTQHTTTPPPRYNDASLISTLEKNGIGRPSTYASIVSTILDRFYIEREENRFIPTLVGNTVSDFLVKNFSDIDDIPFTAAMENKLDAIANGEILWKPMIAEFYAPLEKQLAEAENAEVTKIDLDEKTDKICPLDSGIVLIRRGRFGKFYACGNFPTCKYTAPIIDATQYKCPKDKGDVIVKKTKKGRTFFGCSNYPKCDFAVWTKKQLLKEVGITEQTNE
ncbi:MAG TPA: type I DNA topoisomerase [Candidatus Levybacteria bacterium]|nr:type I DNA topoisomerase [Candidatus Levybacteria bacterium]